MVLQPCGSLREKEIRKTFNGFASGQQQENEGGVKEMKSRERNCKQN